MDNLIEIQRKIIPQAIELMEKRYAILRQISVSEPIGRRMLSSILDLSERATRTEVDFLKSQNLVDISVSGMTITEEGRDVLEKLDLIMSEILGITELEQQLKRILGIKNVVISKNINEKDDEIVRGVAKSASDYLSKKIKPNDKIAIAGGTTMRQIAKSVHVEKSYSKVTILPTRGSVGKDLDIQANSIAALLAKNLGSQVEYLYIPDQLEGKAKEALIEIPDIKNTLIDLKKADKVFISFGRADVMARRRGMKEEDIKKLIDKGAVSEAFGYYFDIDGNVVMKLNTVGIDLDIYKTTKDAVVVFSGKDKIDAFISFNKVSNNYSLITDEVSAREILERIGNN
ncbi:sugar-binding transcriptional regulator [Peptostreptococcus equinus]|uniref:Transcriptional regulator n=1 Tax=Peptostreptococcus equinus TaxID=3003601 RepID=A0ABY7JNL1_9FIRM|nr:sugar-binding domain-containing protein [Peptostreptococcus sp. CBA3647]WAW14451.1 transcriptional regulator [Peptostreptococcus sp. CBA3647]